MATKATAAEREELIALADADTLHMLPKEALIATIKKLAEQLLGLEPLTEAEKHYDHFHKEGLCPCEDEMHVDPKTEQGKPLVTEVKRDPQKFGISSSSFFTPNQGGDRVTSFGLSDGLPT